MSMRRRLFSIRRKVKKNEANESCEKVISRRKSLERKEEELAENLRKMCDENGVELNPTDSSEIFYNLGYIYHHKFINYLNPREARFDCIRAAALYEASIQRRNDTFQRLSYHEKLYSDFLTFCKNDTNSLALEIVQFQNNIKLELNVFRQDLKLKLDNIENPFHGKNPLEIVNDSIERIFQENVEHLLFEGTEFFLSFMKKIFDFSESILGKPPCDFALLGLGSLARKEVTLYSDFESVIVLDQKHDIANLPKCKIYFQNYTTLAFLIIVSLGETILPSVAIKSLNNFENKEGCWFFDKFTKRGITFDGFMPHASKNPIGRLPTKEKPWATELIQPIDVMLQYLDYERDQKEGYHLADVLLQSTFVTGDPFLAEVFRRTAWKRNQEKLNDPNLNQRDVVYSSLIENINAFDYSDLNQGEKLHVKRDIYRGITILLPPIGVLTNIWKQSPFVLLEKLLVRKVISSPTCHDLKTAIAIANYARMVTYMKRKGMSESLTVGIGWKRNSNVNEVFDVAEISALVRLYCIGIRIQRQIKELVKTKDISVLSHSFFFQGVEKGYILTRFEQYDFAITFFQTEIDILRDYTTITSQKLADLYYRVGKCYYYKGDIDEALNAFVLADINCPVNNALHSKILQYLALSYLKIDRGDIAKECLQKSLQIIFQLSSLKLTSFNTFEDLLDNFCRLSGGHITPDLIEMTELAGNILQSKSMFHSALDKYNEVLLKVKKYYGEVLVLQRGEINVIHSIALCQFNLEMYKLSARTCSNAIIESLHLFKLLIPTTKDLFITSINGNKIYCSEAMKTFYDTFLKSMNCIEDIKWCTKLCNFMLNSIEDKVFSHEFSIKRIKTKLQFLIGELYEKDKNFKTAITFYKFAANNFKKLYSKDHMISIQRQAHCYDLLNEDLKSLRLYCVALSIRQSSSGWFYKDTFSMRILRNALQKWNACNNNDDLAQQIIMLSMKPLCIHNESHESILVELDKKVIYHFFKMFFKACIKHKGQLMGIGVLFKLVGVCCYHALCSDEIYSVQELVYLLRLFIESKQDKTETELITYSLIIESLIYISDKVPFYSEVDFNTINEIKLDCLNPKTKSSLYLSAGSYYVQICEYATAIAIYEDGIRNVLSKDLQTPWINQITIDLYQALGIVYSIVGNIEQALASLNTAIDKIQPEDNICRVAENLLLAKSRINLSIFKIYMNKYRKDDARYALLESINNLSQATYCVNSMIVSMSTEFVINTCLLYDPNHHDDVLIGLLKALTIWVKCHKYDEVHILSSSLLKVTGYQQCLHVLGDLLDHKEILSSDKINVFHATITLILDICHFVMLLGNYMHDQYLEYAINQAAQCIFKVPKLFPSCTMDIPVENLRLILSYDLGKCVTYLDRSNLSSFLVQCIERWNNVYRVTSDDFEVKIIFSLVAKLHEQMGNLDDALDCWEKVLSFMDKYKTSFLSFEWSRNMLEVIINLSKCYFKKGQMKEGLESINLLQTIHVQTKKLEDFVKELDSDLPGPDHQCWRLIINEMDKLFDYFNNSEEKVLVQWDYIPIIKKSKPPLTSYDLPMLMKLLYSNEMKGNTDWKKQRFVPTFFPLSTLGKMRNLPDIPDDFSKDNISDIYETFENKTAIEENEDNRNDEVEYQSIPSPQPTMLAAPALPPRTSIYTIPIYINFEVKPISISSESPNKKNKKRFTKNLLKIK